MDSLKFLGIIVIAIVIYLAEEYSPLMFLASVIFIVIVWYIVDLINTPIIKINQKGIIQISMAQVA